MDLTAPQLHSLSTGVFAVDYNSYRILYLDDGMKKFCPGLQVGDFCYNGFGCDQPCEVCPLKGLSDEPFSISSRIDPDTGEATDIIAVRSITADGKPMAFVSYGHVSLSEKQKWLEDKQYQNILRQTHTVAFSSDPSRGKNFISPFVSEYLAGNYNGRSLAQVFLEDEVIHPKDEDRLIRFRQSSLTEYGTHEIAVRLKSSGLRYLWHKMTVSSYPHQGGTMMVGTIVNVDAEKRLQESLKHQAEYSSTTGIFNKAAFYRETERILKEHPGVSYRLLRFDINRFKSINELYGVAQGDRILHYVGKCLTKLARPGETYAHMGNDVFCMCVNRSDEETIQLLDNLDLEINSYPVDFNFIMSTGILRVSSFDCEPLSILCDRAALAQRSVKGNYVFRYAFYENQMGETLTKEHHILGGMRRALEENQFVVYFQPKFNIDSNTIFGAEALVRWNSPKDGLISPGEFIPIFEQNGFILRLDEFVWDYTCQTISRWIKEGREVVPVSVNVSRIHLYDTTFCSKVISMVKKYALDPKLLELEITESAYTENPQSLYGIMESLRKEGFVFSMDDFGSGYSSLNMLKDIPVDVLKIDLNFLKESRRGRKVGQTILESTIHMAQGLDLDVIAEGVETEEQISTLKQAGCIHAQGFYFGRPMPVEEFEKILKSK